MLDVADYADRLIDGFCFFVINLFESVEKLVSNPTRGILRLSARFRAKTTKQASSTTLIFFASAAAQIIIASVWRLDGFINSAFTSRVSEFASDAYTRSFGENLTTTLIAAATITLSAKLQAKGLEKARNISSKKGGSIRLGYYFAYLCIVLFFLEILFSCLLLFVGDSAVPALLVLALSPIVLFLITIANGRPAVPQLKRRDVAIALVALVFAQLVGNSYARLYAVVSGSDQKLAIRGLRCKTVGIGKLAVTAVIENNAEHALIIRRYDLLLMGEKLRRSASGEEPSSAEKPKSDDDGLFFDIDEPSFKDAPYVLLNPRQATILELVGHATADNKTFGEYLCALHVTAHRNDVGDDRGYVNGGPIDSRARAEAYDKFPFKMFAEPFEPADSSPDTKKNQTQKTK